MRQRHFVCRVMVVAGLLLACGGRTIGGDELARGGSSPGIAGQPSAAGNSATTGGAFSPGGASAVAGAPGFGGAAGGLGGAAGSPASFKRGINLGNRLDAPNEGDWGPVLRAVDFSRIAGRGFDHVRLPVRFNAHAAEIEPYQLEADFLERVDWAIQSALASGLSIIVDFHHYEEIHLDPAAHVERFFAIWRQLAARYAALPDSVAFELLNEPSNQLNGSWSDIAAEALAIVRETNPTRLVIIDGPSWAGPSSLFQLSVPFDPQVVASIHSYDPVLFTLQGAEFGGPAFATTGVIYPGPPATPLVPDPAALAEGWPASWFERYNTLPGSQNPSSPTQVAREIGFAKSYTIATGIPVYNGEWGCTEVADFQSRLAWVRDVRRQSEQQGLFGWAIWDDGGAISLYNSDTGEWNEALLAALMDP